MIIKAQLPAVGLDGIKMGEVYERQLFTEPQLKSLLGTWRIRPGTIKDPGQHFNKEIVQFVSRREVAK